MTHITSRQFHQDTSGAKRAASKGPVYITDHGRPAHVLLTFEDFEELLGRHRVLERLAVPVGVEAIDLPLPHDGEPARPATFD